MQSVERGRLARAKKGARLPAAQQTRAKSRKLSVFNAGQGQEGQTAGWGGARAGRERL